MFHKIVANDIPLIKEEYSHIDSFSCDYSVANCFAWADKYKTEIAIIKNYPTLRFRGEDLVRIYMCPLLESGFSEIIDELKKEEIKEGSQYLNILCEKKRINLFTNYFEVVQLRGISDYVYTSENLVNLKGKLYDGKRNHISKFKRKYDWSFVPMTEANKTCCIDIANIWRTFQLDSEEYEFSAIRKMLEYSNELSIIGGLIFVGTQPVAFSLGSCPRPNMFDVHIEKALTEYDGSYAMINREFAEYAHSIYGFKYINREEDRNIENLRKAKLMYHPEFLCEKVLAKIPLQDSL